VSELARFVHSMGKDATLDENIQAAYGLVQQKLDHKEAGLLAEIVPAFVIAARVQQLNGEHD
jgi:hypothetical protein